MVNLLKPLLFALLPVVTMPPTALRNMPAYIATDPTPTSAYVTFVHASKQARDRRRQRQRGRPEICGNRITEDWLQCISSRECRWRFRVTQDELFDMVKALEIPDKIVTPSRYAFDGVEALALTLARFRTAGDQYEMSTTYCRSQSAISEIVNNVVTFIDERWSHLLDFDLTHLLSPPNLEKYAAAVNNAGAPLTGIWGFIDCTIRRIARPSQWQRVAYNGHKKYHALKFQAIMLPNGIFGHLFGPEPGRHNDSFLLNKSQLLATCAEYAVRDGTDEHTPAEERFLQIFGDPAYGISNQIISPFAGAGERTEAELEWNVAMASVRIEVEHGFGIVGNNWPFLNAGWKMYLNSSPVGRYYRAGVLLTNALTCLNENQVSRYFDCQPPDLFNYFHD